MKIVKTLYYEFIVTRFVDSFISWLESEGYDEESEVMIGAMISWANKKKRSLNVEGK